MKNILLLNAGTRNLLVRQFKRTLDGQGLVIATDNYYLAPALYEADKYYITPRITDECYWEKVDEICCMENVGLIVSLIDPELELLAKKRKYYESKGIIVNSSDYKTICSAYHKPDVLNFLKLNRFPWIKTYTSKEDVYAALVKKEVFFPLFIKPATGSGSAGLSKINNALELNNLYKDGDIIQEYMEAQELGVDVFVDLISGEVCSIFAKKKLKMRAGETDKSVSYKNEKLFNIIEKFAIEYGLKGVNDIDVFEKDDIFYISEVNPRFGGGYVHAYECGVDFPKMLVNNMNGIVNEKDIGGYDEGIYMMKYFDIKIMKK